MNADSCEDCQYFLEGIGDKCREHYLKATFDLAEFTTLKSLRDGIWFEDCYEDEIPDGEPYVPHGINMNEQELLKLEALLDKLLGPS